jgi:hypothetical protein
LTLNAALRGFTEAESDDIVQLSTGGSELRRWHQAFLETRNWYELDGDSWRHGDELTCCGDCRP